MRTLFTLLLTAVFSGSAAGQTAPKQTVPAQSPVDILSALDLDRPGLAKVKAALKSGGRTAALRELVIYYRDRRGTIFEDEPAVSATPALIQEADAATRHVFNIGLNYPPQSYGPVVNWSSDPVHDIEWVASMERFYWQRPLIEGYRATHNEKYVKAWMDLTSDWIAKHPVDPPAFDWLDIQVGIRATSMCGAFEVLRHAPSMDPEFLAVFLASIHDHATKSTLYPRLTPHNKAILEDMGLLRIAILFPEFREAKHWLERSFEVFDIALSAQLNPEGVQMEWTPSYHMVVAGEMARVLELCVRNKQTPPRKLMELTRKAYDYWLAMTAPDHYLPMFGDTTRDVHHSPDFTAGDVGAELFHEPEFGLLARHDFAVAPKVGNRAFPEAGMFFFRSGWKPNDIYLALHNSPPALSRHDQPDNGTFELYGFGRWLMPDSGSYAYDNTPHDNEREWFRQTRVHQTLTLDDKNSVNASRTLLWKEAELGSVATFENASYPGLTHRRTVFFVDHRYFVFVDEAIGSATGPLDLHFQFAPGPFSNEGNHTLHTKFPEGGNVEVWEAPDALVDTVAEEGQISSKFNIKEPRPAVAFRARTGTPFVYLTVVAPYKSKQIPRINAKFVSDFAANESVLRIELSVDKEHWSLMRDLSSDDATIRP